jgi:hypothetical protein
LSGGFDHQRIAVERAIMRDAGLTGLISGFPM